MKNVKYKSPNHRKGPKNTPKLQKGENKWSDKLYYYTLLYYIQILIVESHLNSKNFHTWIKNKGYARFTDNGNGGSKIQ